MYWAWRLPGRVRQVRPSVTARPSAVPAHRRPSRARCTDHTSSAGSPWAVVCTVQAPSPRSLCTPSPPAQRVPLPSTARTMAPPLGRPSRSPATPEPESWNHSRPVAVWVQTRPWGSSTRELPLTTERGAGVAIRWAGASMWSSRKRLRAVRIHRRPRLSGSRAVTASLSMGARSRCRHAPPFRTQSCPPTSMTARVARSLERAAVSMPLPHGKPSTTWKGSPPRLRSRRPVGASERMAPPLGSALPGRVSRPGWPRAEGLWKRWPSQKTRPRSVSTQSPLGTPRPRPSWWMAPEGRPSARPKRRN